MPRYFGGSDVRGSEKTWNIAGYMVCNRHMGVSKSQAASMDPNSPSNKELKIGPGPWCGLQPPGSDSAACRSALSPFYCCHSFSWLVGPRVPRPYSCRYRRHKYKKQGYEYSYPMLLMTLFAATLRPSARGRLFQNAPLPYRVV